ncbi:MAG: SPOR domain-containing protein [Gemmatimonadaceae bacterium]|nr:SPOR domain-containing protein [Gemmatimonadaceae bacterium]
MKTVFVALVSALALGLVPAAARAQQPSGTATDDSIFLRAQRLVAEGKADSGRALVQAQLDAATPGTPRYAEALYWHAVVAATAADAERDLRKIIIEYPLAPRSDDALMRLAQLEMTRGDNAQALAHLQRVVIEHPDSPSRARAEFWMARALFDQGNAPAACARLADAARSTPATQVELRNQIDYLNQRCVGVDTTAVVQTAANAGDQKATVTTAATKSAPPAPAASRAMGGVTSHGYTVQVAAYSTRKAAESMRARLLAAGYEARVVGNQKPYRVRIGRYATREAAEKAAAAMRAKKMTVFVTEAESP